VKMIFHYLIPLLNSDTFDKIHVKSKAKIHRPTLREITQVMRVVAARVLTINPLLYVYGHIVQHNHSSYLTVYIYMYTYLSRIKILPALAVRLEH
jgi:hypothetical protein